VRELGLLTAPALLLALIHRSAQNSYSAHFAFREFLEVSPRPLWVASLALLSNLSGNAASKEGKKRTCQ
jgi:hypothetical protein